MTNATARLSATYHFSMFLRIRLGVSSLLSLYKEREADMCLSSCV
jgi:hypothetical protein